MELACSPTYRLGSSKRRESDREHQPNSSLLRRRLVISISHSWGVTDLAAFAHFQQLQRVTFAEHDDRSPAQSAFFLVEALQRIPRTHLTHISCSFADAAYLRSTWPYFGEFPQLQELRLRVCNPMSCPRRPRLTRLALADVRIPLLEEGDIVSLTPITRPDELLLGLLTLPLVAINDPGASRVS